MNIDDALLAEIASLSLGDKPLIVSDVDEVVFEFVTPFSDFLKSRGFELLPRSFHLFGNIVRPDGTEIDKEHGAALLDAFFLDQRRWQVPALDAVETLHSLASDHDIVFLTAMKSHHKSLRRTALDSFGLHFPMIASETPKGDIVRALHGNRPLPVIFLDDIDQNLRSVGNAVPSCLLLRMITNEAFRKLAPPVTGNIRVVESWRDAQRQIQAHCRLPDKQGKA